MSQQPNDEIIDRHLSTLDAELERLRERRGLSAAHLRNEAEASLVERSLKTCCQAVIDLSLHLAARHDRPASDLSQALDASAELGLLPVELAQELRGLDKFQHVGRGYLRAGLLHVFLKQKLEHFERFSAHLRSLTPATVG